MGAHPSGLGNLAGTPSVWDLDERGTVDRQKRFEALFDAYAADVHRYLRRRVANPADVDDLVADVFLVAWRKINEIPHDLELPWLYRTAWMELANQRRKVVPFPAGSAADLESSAPAEADPADRVIEDAEVAAAWKQLGPKEREILRLTAWEGLTGEALARAVGMSTGAAASALSRARSHFAALLLQEASTP